jgi:DNA-binding transcriptional LysR family regulator
MFAWDDLKYFLAFARTGSLGAAANALGVNQSTVQRRLAELEERLGRRLVTRHHFGYGLTAPGQELQRSAEHVEMAATAFEREAAACDKSVTGTIRVTTTGSIADRLRKTLLIDAFQSRHRELMLQLVISDRCLDLSKGEADLAIRAGEPTDEDLVGRKITEVQWAVYAGKSFLSVTEFLNMPKTSIGITLSFVMIRKRTAPVHDGFDRWRHMRGWLPAATPGMNRCGW